MSRTGAIIIEGHVQGLSNTRALGEAGIQVFVLDTGNCIARYSRYCRAFYQCPAYEKDELADFLIELALDKGLAGWLLLPSNDHAVLTISRNKTRLEPYFKFFPPDPTAMERIYDKLRLLDVAKNTDIPVPETFNAADIDSTEKEITFPVLTRGRFGLDFYKATGRKAFLAENMDELREQLSSITGKISIQQTMTQSLIRDDGTNKTISFAAFCVQGKIKAHWMGEKLREHPVRFGTATFAGSVYVEACYTHSAALLKALNYTGVCEIEYLRDPRDGKYKLIEINARTWLWVGLARACGIDFAKIAYEFANNLNPEYPECYRLDLKWINYVTDTFIAWQCIKEGSLGFAGYLKSLKGKKVHAVFDIKDPLPGLMFILMLPYLVRQRTH